MIVIPLYQLCEQDKTLSALLSDSIGLKVSEFSSELFKNPPFVAWQILHGEAEQYLNDVSDMDDVAVQIDVYAKKRADARMIAQQLRKVLFEHCYIERFTGTEQDFETNLWRVSVDTRWHEEPHFLLGDE